MRWCDYWCPDCKKTKEDVFYRKPEDVREDIPCKCGGEMKRLWGAQIIIDSWSPMTNDAKRDMDHFAKKNKGRLYRIDQQKENLNSGMNLSEV